MLLRKLRGRWGIQSQVMILSSSSIAHSRVGASHKTRPVGSRAAPAPAILIPSNVATWTRTAWTPVSRRASPRTPQLGPMHVCHASLHEDSWRGEDRVSWDNVRESSCEPGLYLVATPIGNLQDITLRALNVLRYAGLVLAEDTRHTRKLLNHFNIKADTTSYHSHNEKQGLTALTQRLEAGEAIALVSDAGTPAISDPGYLLVKAAIEAGIKVIPVPGACAAVTALIASGLPTNSFTFCGFLPPKQGARRSCLAELRGSPSTLILYAPPHGLTAILEDMIAVLGGQRRVCVARELTKIHEEFFRSTLNEALVEFTSRTPRGEIVLIVEGYNSDGGIRLSSSTTNISIQMVPDRPLSDSTSGEGRGADEGAEEEVSVESLLERLISSGMPASAAAKDVASALGLKKKDVYALAVNVHARLQEN